MQSTRLRILKAVQKLSLTGWPPTRREIGEAVGIESTGNINHHIDRLEQCGYVIRRPGRVGVLATDEGREAIALSLLPLTQRTAIGKERHKSRPGQPGDYRLTAAWHRAIVRAKHGLFDIVEPDESEKDQNHHLP